MTTIALTRRTVTQTAQITGIEPVTADGAPHLIAPTEATVVLAGGRAQSIELTGPVLREDGTARKACGRRMFHRTPWSGWAHVPADVAALVADLEATAAH